MKKSKKQKRKEKSKNKSKSKTQMLYTNNQYKHFLKEIQDIRGKNLEEIRAKVVRGGSGAMKLWYGIIDFFTKLINGVGSFWEGLTSTSAFAKSLVKFFSLFHIGDILSAIFSILGNIINFFDTHVITPTIKDISKYGIQSKWTWGLITVGSLGIFDYIAVGTTLLNGTGIPTWILTNVNSNLNPFNFVLNVICTITTVIGNSIGAVWSAILGGNIIVILLVLLTGFLLIVAIDMIGVEESNEYYKQRSLGKNYEEAMEEVRKLALKAKNGFDKEYLKKVREVAEKAIQGFEVIQDEQPGYIASQIQTAITTALADRINHLPELSEDTIRTVVTHAITNFPPSNPNPLPSNFNAEEYKKSKVKAAGEAVVKLESVKNESKSAQLADNYENQYIAKNSPIRGGGRTTTLRNIPHRKIEELNEKYPTHFIMAQLAGLIKENDKGEYYYTEQADKTLDIIKKDTDRIIRDNCSGEDCEQTSMKEQLEAILFVHTASYHASIRKDTESNTSGGGIPESDFDILNHLKEEDVKWMKEKDPDQIKSAQRLGLLDGLTPTKKCRGIIKSSQTLNGKSISYR